YPVQVEVHRTQAHHLVHDVNAMQRAMAQLAQLLAILALALHVLEGCQQEAAGTASRVAHAFPDARVDALDNGLDHRARGEVLPGAGPDLGGIALQQALIDLPFDVDALPDPRAFAVDQTDHALELGRIGKLILRLAEDRAYQAIYLRQG